MRSGVTNPLTRPGAAPSKASDRGAAGSQQMSTPAHRIEEATP
jgi:hypothetical protein